MASSAPARSPTSRCSTELNGKPLRLFLIGFEPGRPGGPRHLSAGRDILRGHYEAIVDRSAGLKLGQDVPLGTHGHKFTVVGLMTEEVTSSGDPVAYITLRDAQQLQFELAPPAARRELARGGGLETNDQVNAIIAKVSPFVPVMETAAALSRWKHLTALTQDHPAGNAAEQVRHRAGAQAAGLIMVLLVIVSAVIIALIIYTLTMEQGTLDRHAQICGGAGPDHHRPHCPAGAIDGHIWLRHGLGACPHVQALLSAAAGLDPESVAIVFVITIVVCLLASTLGIRLALKVDPAEALASSG